MTTVEHIAALLGRQGFLPHGYCFSWQPGLLWTMVASNLVIAAAYFSIPLALLTFVKRRQDASLRGVAWLFGAFIFACGLSHLADVWVIWQPDYAVQALGKGLTAGISALTAIVLWPLIPRALKIPTPTQLQAAITSLEAEIQQRKSTENSLLETQEALVITLASIGAGFIATDALGHVVRMNTTAEAITGWREHEALGQSLWDVFQREDRPPSYEGLNPVEVMIGNGATIDQVHRVVAIARDGRRTSIEVQGALTHAPDRSVKGLALVFRDMTKLNQAATEANLLAAIVESSHDAIIGKTLDGRITSWNEGAQAMFGYTAEEALGRSVLMLIPADRPNEEMAIVTDLAAGIRVPAFETKRRRKDGSLVDVSITISPIRDDQGRIIGASKVARDITDQKQSAQLMQTGLRLEAENRQIQEASRIKSEFLANMSHELRTPLNAVIGFADLLHSGAVPVTSPKHHDFLGHIGTSGRHLLQLINDVLDLSKVESGKFEFVPEPVDLRQLAKEVTDVLHTAALRQEVRIDTHIDDAVSHLDLDPARLKQALYNYLSNAIKFTPRGGLITLRATPEGVDCVRIEVEDTGIGIAPQDLPRLFVEFQQLDGAANKQHPGTGLGLALTKRLVQAQGGTVGVRSTPGVGSVFHLVLPQIMTADGTPAQAHDSGLRYLLIQENLQDQAQMISALTQLGVHADSATNGQQAASHAAQTSYTAITLDLVLPDGPGLSVLSSIREGGPSADTPVVAVSMSTTTQSRASFPITDLLSKPIEARQIGVALDKCGLIGRMGTKVMVVDDDPLALELMGSTLAALGIEPVGISSGLMALQKLDQHQPDAIILDLMMPGFDGFAVLDALQQHPRWRDIPVFIWTSMLLTDEEYDALARSAHAVLSKGGGAMAALLQDIQRRCARMRTPLGDEV